MLQKSLFAFGYGPEYQTNVNNIKVKKKLLSIWEDYEQMPLYATAIFAESGKASRREKAGMT